MKPYKGSYIKDRCRCSVLTKVATCDKKVCCKEGGKMKFCKGCGKLVHKLIDKHCHSCLKRLKEEESSRPPLVKCQRCKQKHGTGKDICDMCEFTLKVSKQRFCRVCKSTSDKGDFVISTKCKTCYGREYSKKNKGKRSANTSSRRATKIKAEPPWLSEEHKLEIERIYKRCKAGYHVDHIVPLKSKLVCGLHVPWNLQHLKKDLNLSKGNRWWPDMWENDNKRKKK